MWWLFSSLLLLSLHLYLSRDLLNSIAYLFYLKITKTQMLAFFSFSLFLLDNNWMRAFDRNPDTILQNKHRLRCAVHIQASLKNSHQPFHFIIASSRSIEPPLRKRSLHFGYRFQSISIAQSPPKTNIALFFAWIAEMNWFKNSIWEKK